MVPLLNRGGMMKGFVQEADREQTTLLPECLDDWVGESTPVRAVDVFVDGLELPDLGLGVLSMRGNPAPSGSMASIRQRPAGPRIILRRCSSFISTAISTESNRAGGWSVNLEVMWLTGRLVPDHKTIADFRKDN